MGIHSSMTFTQLYCHSPSLHSEQDLIATHNSIGAFSAAAPVQDAKDAAMGAATASFQETANEVGREWEGTGL